MSRELRFGVRMGDRFSQYWQVRADATRPDIYLASQRTGRFLHVSVHDPSYGMHVAVTLPSGTIRKTFPHPPPLVSGVTRLVQLRVPLASVTEAVPQARAVKWVGAVDDPEIWTAFEILVEEEGAAAKETDWSHGALLVGRAQRADGGSIAVASWPMRGEGGSLSLPATTDEKARMLEVAAEGKLQALVHGLNPDGSIWFLELRGEVAESEGEASRGATVEP